MYKYMYMYMGFPGCLDSEESACNAGDPGLIPGLGRFPGGGHGNPLWYFCLENPMDRGAWQATVHGVTKSQTQLSSVTNANTHTHTHMYVTEYFAEYFHKAL